MEIGHLIASCKEIPILFSMKRNKDQGIGFGCGGGWGGFGCLGLVGFLHQGKENNSYVGGTTFSQIQ